MAHQTALYKQHQQENARLVDFAGWEMPLQYESITAEHEAVRTGAGIFDVGHMGRFFIKGGASSTAVKHVIASRTKDMDLGQIRYTTVCNHDGGTKDDVLVTRFGPDRFYMVVNASNREKLLAWFKEHLVYEGIFKDQTLETGMVAIQGPDALRITEQIAEYNLKPLQYYHAMEFEGDWIISRTGYTGEDGFEIIAPNSDIESIWKQAREAGAVPCGLGARDSLRLEMGYPLYGHELNETISPLEAGIGWVVHFDKDEFIGKQALVNQKDKGIPRRRLGFILEAPGVPRQDYTVYHEDTAIGTVTSGGFSSTLKKGIGLALVSPDYKKLDRVTIDIRGKKIPAIVLKPPFVEKHVKG